MKLNALRHSSSYQYGWGPEHPTDEHAECCICISTTLLASVRKWDETMHLSCGNSFPQHPLLRICSFCNFILSHRWSFVLDSGLAGKISKHAIRQDISDVVS